jgi:hypothetical protein
MKKKILLFYSFVFLVAACKKNDQPSPPTGTGLSATISSQLTAIDSLSNFANFFKAAKLSDADVAQGITVFAPSNSAFGSGQVNSAAMLPDSSVLRDYIVKGVLKPDGFTNNMTLTTLSGKTLTVTVVGDPVVMINGVVIHDTATASGSSYTVYPATQLLNAAAPLSFSVWDATQWAPGKPKGTPSVQATVSLYRSPQDYASDAQPAYSSRTGSDGTAVFNNVLPGEYYVVAANGQENNIFSLYTEPVNGTFIGYAADTVMDNSGNIVWQDINRDGRVDSHDDQAILPATPIQAAKNKPLAIPVLIGYLYKPLETLTDAQNKLNSVYSGLLPTYMNLLIIDGMLSGQASCGVEPSFCPFTGFSDGATTPVLGTIWNNAYFTGIIALNYVLRDVPNMSITDAQKADLLAQAKGLRGYIYLELLSYFGNLPLDNDLTDSFFPGIANSSPQQVYNQIVSDLTSAAADLPVTRTDGSGAQLLTKGAALGLLAKAALWNKDYSGVVNYTSQVISSGIYSLSPNLSWLTNAGASETIWAPAFSQIGASASEYYSGAFGSTTVQLVPVLRYTEILLMNAEAQIALGVLATAAQDLNLIGTRNGQPAVSFTGVAAADSALTHVWSTELYRQGDYFTGLVRLGIAQQALGSNYKANINEWLPIPLSFLNTYIGIIQNPGY